jgi:two-component system NarL family sensor kinase
MNARTAARLGWGACAVTLLLVAALLTLVGLRGSESVAGFDQGAQEIFVATALALGFSVFGALIVTRHPAHPIGWLFCVAGLTAAITGFTEEYAARALLIDHGSLPAGEAMAWLSSWMWIGLLPLLGTVGVLLFPDGRLPAPRWRFALWLAIATLVALVAGFGFTDDPLEEFPSVDNPVGFLPDGLKDAAGSLFFPAVLVCLASVVVRYRRSVGDERQQLRWVASGAGFFIAVLIATAAIPEGWNEGEWLSWGVNLASLGLVASAGVAILRHRLYDLDLVVNRTLVYGLLTGLVVGVYVGLVAGLGELLDSTGIGVSLIATAAVAVAIQPARSLIQARVDRLMYGDRGDPYRALSRLGERLEQALDPDAVLPAIVETVADGLRLPYVAIELDEAGGRRIVASHGEARRGELARVPLSYRGEEVGRLLAAPRQGDDALGAADIALLADLARQAGVAAHAVRLTQDLRRSRERLVAAREEERRRLRRDLHDGLGPTLAGIALELESGRALVDRDPGAARELLARLRGEVQESIADIRRIAYDLRPPTLDELGLVEAVREQAARLSTAGRGGDRNGLRVSIETPEQLPPLPAAVEVAAYRIALEALTNVSRHAGASNCTVRIAVNGELELVIRDDGAGVGAETAGGIGLTSMRERAEELGGSLSVEPNAGGRGTVVAARLPLEDV